MKKYKILFLILLLFLIGSVYLLNVSSDSWGEKYCSQNNTICLTPLQKNPSLSSAYHMQIYKGAYFTQIFSPFIKNWITFKDADELAFDRRNGMILIYVNGSVDFQYKDIDEKSVSIILVSGDPCSFVNKQTYQYSLEAKCSSNNGFHE